MLSVMIAMLLAAPSAEFENLRAADLRIASVGERLAIASLPYCPDHGARTGLVVHDIAQYPAGAAGLRETFGFSSEIAVEAVVPGSAAARAGVKANDGIVAIAGTPLALPPAKPDAPSYGRMDAVNAALQRAAEAGAFTLSLTRDGQPVEVTVTPVAGCRSLFQLIPAGGYDASADGAIVQLTGKFYEFTRSDDELAALLAHELSHNILHHRARLDAAGVSTGLLSSIGPNAAKIRETENQADRLAVYILQRAGYDANAAVTLFDRFGRKHGFGIFSDSTHLRVGKRTQQLRDEIAAMTGKLHAGQPLAPDFVPLAR